MSSHTPGPWTFNSPYVVSSSGTIATIKETKHNKANEANARLIAAAPTMHDYIAKRAAAGDEEAAKILGGECHAL